MDVTSLYTNIPHEEGVTTVCYAYEDFYGDKALYRGTQREYSSKPLKHSIVKRVLVFKRWIWAYFYPL